MKKSLIGACFVGFLYVTHGMSAELKLRILETTDVHMNLLS